MLWAPGFYKCHWLIFASNYFEFQDLKQRGFRWQEVKSWVCMACIAAGSEHLWVPLCYARPQGWFLVREKLCSPAQLMDWNLSSNSPLSGSFILCNRLLSSLSDWPLLFTSEFSFVMAWCWPLPEISHEHLLSCLMFVDFSCQSSAHLSSFSSSRLPLNWQRLSPCPSASSFLSPHPDSVSKLSQLEH